MIIKTILALLLPLSAAAQEARGPMMGWCSWDAFHVNISDTLIMAQADALAASPLRAAGYDYVNIDDGFFGRRDDSGVMRCNGRRFPGGMKAVADHIHNLGLKAGLYSDAGYITCGSIYDGDTSGVGAGMYGHERQDAETYFNDWGYDFIKIDYCGAGHELSLEEQKRYSEVISAIREVADRPVKINVCRWAFPGAWVCPLADSWRVSSDIRAKWWSVKATIEKNMYLSPYASTGHYNDMDMLVVGRGLPVVEEETNFAVWCMMSSPLFISCDLRSLTERSLGLLTNEELLAVDRDPLGEQAYVAARCGEGYILVRDLEKRHGEARAVALYNPTDSDMMISVNIKDIEMTGTVRLRDLLRHREEMPSAGIIQRLVPAHGVHVMRAEGQRVDAERYEGEWAFLRSFRDINITGKTPTYAPADSASGGMVITNIGGSRENTARWDNVYSSRGGAYKMTIVYKPRKISGMTVVVNGTPTVLDSRLSSEGGMTTVTLPVTLHKGRNTIEIGCGLMWTPDIDMFTLQRLSETD